MKKFTLSIVLCLVYCALSAQTVLQAGDLAFIGTNADGPTYAEDSFAFVLLKDIEAGTQVKFTDRGWNDGIGFFEYPGDSQFTWTSGIGRSVGDIIILYGDNLYPGSYSVIGDQIFAYQGDDSSPTFIAGLHTNVTASSTDDNWDGAATSNSTSALPDQLENGVNAIRFTTEYDNGQFSAIKAGGNNYSSVEELRSAINNINNWNFNDIASFDPVAEPGIDFVVITNTPPVAANFTVLDGPYESLIYTFNTSDFGYSDADGDVMDHLLIETIPTVGILYLDANDNDLFNEGEEVAINDQISKADLDAGNLQYFQNGAVDSSFQFDVNDGKEYSSNTYTAMLNIVAKAVVNSVAVPPNATYVGGENLDFTVNFNNDVYVNSTGGTPRLGVLIGNAQSYAGYISGSGTGTLMFRYTIQFGDFDTDGISVNDLTTNGGTIKDAGYNDANLSLNNIGSTANVFVDAAAPKGYAVSIDQGTIDYRNETTVSFTFSGAEVGATYNYSFSTSNGPETVTGSGTILTATDQITGIDLSRLAVGTITLSAKLTDGSGNIGNEATATVEKNSSFRPFITTWKTDNVGTSSSTSITIPTTGTGYNYDVDWDNDGIYDDLGVTGSITHDYGTVGTYTVAIRRDFPRIYFTGANNNKILFIEQWGDIEWSSMNSAFQGCGLLEVVATDVPDLTNVTDMSKMFYYAKVGSPDFSGWDVSHVTNMQYMFRESDLVDGNISGWNVGNVTDMTGMFAFARSFNADLNSWNTSNVLSMAEMFHYALSFNRDLNNWDTSKVTDMWGMFAETNNFNGDISSWNVSSVTNMSYMFSVAKAFSGDLGAWDVSNVTDMNNMFFAAISFNGDIGQWDVSNVTNMRLMFYNVTNFDQDLGNWDISSLTNAENMFQSVALSTSNYDSLLKGWSSVDEGETQIPVNLAFDGGNSKYCGGRMAREELINSYGWTITDGGIDTSCDIEPPAGYNIAWDDDWINASEASNTSFTVSDAEVGTTLNYSISSSGDGNTATITGSFLVTDANQSFNTDVSSLTDGNLLLEVSLTDDNANTGIIVSDDSVNLDQTAPSAFTVSIDQVIINGTNETAASFTTPDAEFGATYNYTISSSNGGTVVTGSGVITHTTIPGTGNFIPYQETGIDLSSLANGTLTLTVILTDYAGNPGASATDTVVKDTNNAPVAVCSSFTAQLDDTGNITISASDVDGGSSDDRPEFTLSLSQYSFDCSNIGTNQVVLKVTDSDGLEDTCLATVTVEDNVAPVATAKNISVQLDANGVASVTPEMINNESSDACGIADLRLDVTEFSCADVGKNQVVLTVEDKNGNTSEAPATVTVEDNLAPVAKAKDITVQLDENGAATITSEMINDESSDACGIAKLRLDITEFSCADVGENPVVLTVEDNNGNTSAASATVTVEDNLAPVANAKDITVQLDENGAATITSEMINNGSSDACGIAELRLDVTEFSCEDVGANTVTLTVEDKNGNTSVVPATVTVQDNVAPVLAVKNITVELNDMGLAVITPQMIDNGSSDACGIISRKISVSQFNCSSIGENTILFTVVDNNGNEASMEAIVTVKDNLAPVPVMEHLELITAECIVEEGDVIIPMAIDNCETEITVTHNIEFPITSQGSTMITWMYEDGSGNTSTQVQEVLIKDETAPVPDVAELQDIVVQCEVLSIPAPTATDNCGGSFPATTTDSRSYDQQGRYTVTWVFDDGNGNTTSQTQKVIVEDTTIPEVKTRDITVYLDPVDNVSITADDIDAGSVDNCGDVSLSIDRDYFDASGSYEVLLTATDEVGNTATATAIVTVEVDGIETDGVHVLPTTLKRSSVAKVVVPFRSRIIEVQVIEAETNRYKAFKGNNSFEMEINVAPFKGTLLVRIVDDKGTVHLKKLIAL